MTAVTEDKNLGDGIYQTLTTKLMTTTLVGAAEAIGTGMNQPISTRMMMAGMVHKIAGHGLSQAMEGEDHRASNGKGHSMIPKATMDTTVAVLHGDWRSRMAVLMATGHNFQP